MATFFTIFGASGDLAKLKIYPALFTLAQRQKLKDDFFIVGYARSEFSREEFFEIFRDSVRRHTKDWGESEEKTLEYLREKIHYITAPYDSIEGFEKYRSYITTLSDQDGVHTFTQVLYLAVPPSVVSPILSHFSDAFHERATRDIRVILEKPFGHDEYSARELLAELKKYYKDDELYFLDHYMGKKSMRSLLSLRAKNRIIDTILNPVEIDRIEISALEDFGVKERVGYFESVGIIRDMIQSHLFEMLALLTLALPSSLNPVSISHARRELLDTLDFSPNRDYIVLGQYATYKEDNEMTKDSSTETYVALSLRIDDPKWRSVPIYMRSGKSLEKKETFIVVTFKKAEHAGAHEEPNRMIITLYPEESISLRFLDESGDRRETHEVVTKDSIRGDEASYLGSHELLFLDAIDRERRFFLTPEEILASWKCVDRIFASIKEKNIKPEIYPNHSSGPKGQYEVLSDWYALGKTQKIDK